MKVGDRYQDAAERIENGRGTQADRDLLEQNWGRHSRWLDVKVQRYQDAVKKYDKSH